VRTDPIASVVRDAVPAESMQDRVRAAVDAHAEVLWRFLRRMGVAEQDAEDAGQAVFLVFARRVGTIALGAERSFLLGTALRVAANYRKEGHRAREVAVGEDALADAPHPGPDQEDEAERKRRREWLDLVLDRLAPELREVFVLAEIEEMTMAEIALVLRIPPGTVASRLRRAREVFQTEATTLRSQLEKAVRR
jgi:RNA polymerase sigma-70 factor (ECF subfamily)